RELVDAPDEAGAVVSAARLHAEVDLGTVARAAPDVGHADPTDGRVQDPPLPEVEGGELERVGEALDGRDLPAVPEPAEARYLRGRVRGLGARRGIPGQQLEEVLRGRVVRPQAEQAGDDLGAEARRHVEPGGARLLLELRGGLREA